jgi:hypothetical protein
MTEKPMGEISMKQLRMEITTYIRNAVGGHEIPLEIDVIFEGYKILLDTYWAELGYREQIGRKTEMEFFDGPPKPHAGESEKGPKAKKQPTPTKTENKIMERGWAEYLKPKNLADFEIEKNGDNDSKSEPNFEKLKSDQFFFKAGVNAPGERFINQAQQLIDDYLKVEPSEKKVREFGRKHIEPETKADWENSKPTMSS